MCVLNCTVLCIGAKGPCSETRGNVTLMVLSTTLSLKEPGLIGSISTPPLQIGGTSRRCLPSTPKNFPLDELQSLTEASEDAADIQPTPSRMASGHIHSTYVCCTRPKSNADVQLAHQLAKWEPSLIFMPANARLIIPGSTLSRGNCWQGSWAYRTKGLVSWTGGSVAVWTCVVITFHIYSTERLRECDIGTSFHGTR